MWRPPSLPMINECASSSDLSIVMRSPCAGDAPCLAQETRKRRDLQLALHALACSSRCTFSAQQACCTSRDPLRDEIREVGRRLSLADTQTGRYGRLYSRRRLDSTRSCRRSTLLACSDPFRTSLVRSCIPIVTGTALGLTLPSVCVLVVYFLRTPSHGAQSNSYSGASSREHGPRVYAICRPELG